MFIIFTYTYENGELTLTNNFDVTIVQVKNPITQEYFKDEEDALAWATEHVKSLDDVIDLTSVLDKLKSEKSKEIEKSYYNQMCQGFDSEANGDKIRYPYDKEAQDKFSKLFLSKANGIIMYPVSIFALDGTEIKYTEEELQKLLQDITVWEWSLQNKLHELLAKVKSSDSKDVVEEVVW